MKAKNAGEFFGTLQQSIVAEWRKHLKTSKYSKHMALDEFYTEMPELVDQLIEDYQAVNGVIDEYSCAFESSSLTALEYLEELREFIKDSRSEFIDGESELESDLDNILSLIDSTIYKVRELKENKIMSLKSYLNESLNVNEAVDNDGEVVYQGFKKIDQETRTSSRLKRALDTAVRDWSFLEDLDIPRKNVDDMFGHFIGWCVMAADEFDDLQDWYDNIVQNDEQYIDGGLEDFRESYDYDVPDSALEDIAEIVRTQILPLVYKSIVKHDIKIY